MLPKKQRLLVGLRMAQRLQDRPCWALGWTRTMRCSGQLLPALPDDLPHYVFKDITNFPVMLLRLLRPVHASRAAMRVATVLTSRPQTVCNRCLSARTQPCSTSTWHALPVRQQTVFRRSLAAAAGQTTGDEDPAQQQLREAATLDKLIDAMLDAKNQQEVPSRVA